MESVNEEVLKGVPFREAYKKIGAEIDGGTFAPSGKINHTHEGSIGNLCNKEIGALMNDVLAGFRFEKVEAAISRLVKA